MPAMYADACLASFSDPILSATKSLDDLFRRTSAVTPVVAVVALVKIAASDLSRDDVDDLLDLVAHGAPSAGLSRSTRDANTRATV
jgi:hypothetical protein